MNEQTNSEKSMRFRVKNPSQDKPSDNDEDTTVLLQVLTPFPVINFDNHGRQCGIIERTYSGVRSPEFEFQFCH